MCIRANDLKAKREHEANNAAVGALHQQLAAQQRMQAEAQSQASAESEMLREEMASFLVERSSFVGHLKGKQDELEAELDQAREDKVAIIQQLAESKAFEESLRARAGAAYLAHNEEIDALQQRSFNVAAERSEAIKAKDAELQSLHEQLLQTQDELKVTKVKVSLRSGSLFEANLKVNALMRGRDELQNVLKALQAGTEKSQSGFGSVGAELYGDGSSISTVDHSGFLFDDAEEKAGIWIGLPSTNGRVRVELKSSRDEVVPLNDEATDSKYVEAIKEKDVELNTLREQVLQVQDELKSTKAKLSLRGGSLFEMGRKVDALLRRSAEAENVAAVQKLSDATEYAIALREKDAEVDVLRQRVQQSQEALKATQTKLSIRGGSLFEMGLKVNALLLQKADADDLANTLKSMVEELSKDISQPASGRYDLDMYGDDSSIVTISPLDYSSEMEALVKLGGVSGPSRLCGDDTLPTSMIEPSYLFSESDRTPLVNLGHWTSSSRMYLTSSSAHWTSSVYTGTFGFGDEAFPVTVEAFDCCYDGADATVHLGRNAKYNPRDCFFQCEFVLIGADYVHSPTRNNRW